MEQKNLLGWGGGVELHKVPAKEQVTLTYNVCLKQWWAEATHVQSSR